jgi:glucose-1-phosphate adenylyltransferase
MHDNLIILAGGASSRMKSQLVASQNKNLSKTEVEQANVRSKGLISVGPDNRPLLDYLLLNAKQAGYRNIYIVIGEDDQLFHSNYGEAKSNNDFHGLNISFAIQYIPEGRTKPLGTADALFQAVTQYPHLNMKSYTVCNSDNLYSLTVLKKLRETEAQNALIGYDRDSLQFSTERIARFALLKLDRNNHVLDIEEKPELNIIESFKDDKGKLRVSMNIFNFDGQQLYPYLKNCPMHPVRMEKELPTALIMMLDKFPKSVLGIPVSENVPDLTAKEDILIVKEYLKNAYPNFDWNK